MRARGAVVLALLAGACRGGGTSELRPPAGPASAVSAVSASAPVDAAASDDASAPALDDGLPRVAVVLDDPRLAAARERDRAQDPSGAAKVVDAALAAAPSLEAEAACAWAYSSGRLHALAGEHVEAAAAFERALGAGGDAGAPWALAPYASLRAAEELVRLGRYDEALARASAVGDDLAARDEARLALADAYVGKGDRASAVPVWRALLAASPHGLRWADTSLQLAAALLDGVDGPAETHASEALDLATRVLVESPMAAEKADVTGLRERAARRVRPPASLALSPEERARQAQAWLDAHQSKRAAEVAEALLDALPKADAKHREVACRAATLRAQALPRGKETADAWGAAIERCQGDALAGALYQGGKASASARRPDEALDRFGRVERLSPTSRFADDARLRAAQILKDRGEAAKAAALLASLPDTYPEGDMRSEALFRLALDAIEAHDLDAARAALDRASGVPADDHASGSPGRVAYFRARVSQLVGDLEGARARYAALVAEHPLSFYMLLAIERLRALDEGAARAAVDAAIAREPAGPWLEGPHPELASPAFERFRRLLEVGEVDAARREAGAGGLVAEGADPDVLWTVGWVYDRAGAPELGHVFARGRLTDFRRHWPAGRWRLPWEVAFPRAWADAVTRESAAAGTPAPLTWAIMREESAFNPDARSAASALGLMQLLLGTGRQLARGTPLAAVDDAALRRPEVSISLGARLLASLRGSFQADPALAIAAYNGGSSPVRRWLGERGGDDFDVFVERIPYEETRNYLKRVLTSEAAYAFLYAPDVLRELEALPERAAGP